MNSLGPLLERLDAAGAQLASTRQRVEDGSPWPVGAVAEGAGERDWGPGEVLAHVSEMLPFWLGEMERVIAGADGHDGTTGRPAPFGRTAADPVRTLTVARDASLPVRDLYDRIASVLQRYRRRIPELTDAEIRCHGLHPALGELSVAELLDRFALTHLEEHARQLDRILGR